MPEPRSDRVRRCSRHDPDARRATRRRRSSSARRRTPGVREALAERHRSHDDRPRRGRRRRRRAHARQHGDGPRRSTRRRAVRCSAAAAAASPGPRSSRSRCVRCTTVTRALPGVPIIGTGGVQTGVDAVEMLLAGASAVGVGTANFRDPRAPLRVLDELARLVRAHDVARVRDLIGGCTWTERLTMTDEPRDHLALALDVGDLDARRRRRPARCQPWFGVAKVGFELYAAAGPEAFDALRDKGFRVFADLKLHDIPTTVGRGRARARPPRRRLPQLPRGRRCRRCCAPASKVSPKARATRVTRRRSRSRSPCSPATRTSTRSTHACDAAATRGCDGVVCAGTEVDVARARRASHDGSRRPARRWRRARPGARRHARRRDRARAPTGSSSVAR